MPFVRNAWYVAGWSRDLGREPLAATVLGRNVVLWRGGDGAPRAVEDLCPHRYLPLSKGRVRGDRLQCGYHGLTFDGDGRCVDAPTQDSPPDGCRVQAYPAAERMGMIWIWTGDPARADRSAICDLDEYHREDWAVAFGDALDVEANYLLLCDNLCDPTHVNYVHPTTLGNPDEINAPVTHEETSWGVITERLTPDSGPTGFVRAFGSHPGKVDLWQRYLMRLPSVSIIDFGAAAAGTGGFEGGGEGRIQVFSCHFMTPVTETRTIDRWLHARNFRVGDDAAGEAISSQFRVAFAEDKEILEAVQVEEARRPGGRKVGLDLDASAGLFRRGIDRLLREEARTA